MLGGASQQGRILYENFIETADKHLFYRPMTLNEEDILLSGSFNKAKGEEGTLRTEAQHLTCFVGGMLALAGKIFQRQKDVEDGAKMAGGCVWAYKSTATGIMPETFTAVACEDRTNCSWNETAWWQAIAPGSSDLDARSTIDRERLPPGFASIQDKRYLLRYVIKFPILTSTSYSWTTW
jgi:mannosyl-oligosaccharide alpha-1,2-mannosidase